MQADVLAGRAPNPQQSLVDLPGQSGMQSGYAAPQSQGQPDFIADKNKGTVEGRQRSSDNMRDYANALRGKSAPQGRTAGPLNVYYGPNIGESLGYAGEQLMGGYMAGKANKEDVKIDKARSLEKARLEGIETDRYDRDQVRKDETLQVKKDTLAEIVADGESVVMVSPDGKNEVGAVQRNGMWFEPDGKTPWGEGKTDRKGWKSWKKPVAAGAGGTGRDYVTKIDDGRGNEVLMRVNPYDPNSVPQFMLPGEDGKNSWTEDKAAAFAAVRAETEATKAGKVKGAEALAANNVARMQEIEDGLNGMERTAVLYGQAMDAMLEGAKTGYIEGNKWSPTISSASIILQNVQDQLGLEKIGEYTFGSLSEAEGQWVRDSSIPKTLSEEQIIPWIQHKYESQMRAIQAEKFELKYRRKYHESPRREYIDQILKRDGFEFGAAKSWADD